MEKKKLWEENMRKYDIREEKYFVDKKQNSCKKWK